MRLAATVLGLVVAWAETTDAQTVLAGASAARWEPRPGWVRSVPRTYGVTEEAGALVFAAEGAGTEIPWQITLKDEETAADARYLALRYRAEGLSDQKGNYFVHGWEGTPGGLTYATSDLVEPDGAWHTLAVDLMALRTQGDTVQIAVKVIVGATGAARLTVERLWFADEAPEGATMARTAEREARSLVLDWRQVGELKPAPAWTASPATDFSAAGEGSAVVFTVRGTGRQMRWPLALPEPVDLDQLPYFSLRYRASGQLGLGTYAVWLGDQASGAGGHSCIPLLARDLRADGQWHTVTVRLKDRFSATHLAVGLDSAGDEARMALDTITFSSLPPTWPLAQLLPYEPRPGAWPEGREGLTVLTPSPRGGKPSPFLVQRLALSDWFTTTGITVAGVPFVVPESPHRAPQTGTAALGTLETPLPAEAREVYLLTAATAPATEPWGIDWAHPRPVEMLSQPEKVVFEVRYADGGPPDFLLPLDLATGQWGMKRGLGVCVAHPDPARRPVALLLHDRMQTASFAVLGVTVRTDGPRVAEPDWASLAYAPPPAGALARLGDVRGSRPGFPLMRSGSLGLQFALQPSLRWWALHAGASEEALACAPGPVFEVVVGGQTLPWEAWQIVEFSPLDQGFRFVLRQDDTSLRATLDCLPGAPNAVSLRLSLENEGAEPITATLRFPFLRGVRLGSAAETWYLFGKRGGIINHVPVSFREPLGERHPLQVDGFFNPGTGLALACLTHDTVAQHHFLRLGKTAEGGEWAPEYVERDLAPGAAFTATEAELVLCEGDWRAILDTYRQWLRTWFRPPVAKPWWQRTFAFITRNAHHDSFSDPRLRGAIQPAVDDCRKYLGLCDYVHLFGWSSSKTYGNWGDYEHYDEAVGGLDYFRGNIADVQASGVAVGLYQDAYLSSVKGQAVGAQAREWAMKRPDGSPNYVGEYDAYNQCPYMQGWRQHLARTYARIVRETGVKGMYVDEYGATDGRWLCCAKEHGHNGYEVPYAGEVEVLKALREAVGPEVALYSEYPPAEVSRQYLDGSFTYQALWSADEEPLAPCFLDLPRFAFPGFKQFHIIYYVAPRAGNWWLIKFPFFNGESYNIGQPNLPGYDAASLAFQRRAIEVLCAHREAFSSPRVDPLVTTELAGVFANAFIADTETVWTLYNANGRSVHAPCLRVPHMPGATYEDAWEGEPMSPTIEDGFALLALDLGPKAVGCVVQKR